MREWVLIYTLLFQYRVLSCKLTTFYVDNIPNRHPALTFPFTQPRLIVALKLLDLIQMVRNE